MDWSAVDYCDVFIRLSFWRHPFTTEHCWDTDAVMHLYKPDEETNSSWSLMIQGEHILIFGWTIPLMSVAAMRVNLKILIRDWSQVFISCIVFSLEPLQVSSSSWISCTFLQCMNVQICILQNIMFNALRELVLILNSWGILILHETALSVSDSC